MTAHADQSQSGARVERRCNSAIAISACAIGSRRDGRICTRPRATGSSASQSPPGGARVRARSMWMGWPVFIRSPAGSMAALAAATMWAVER